MESTLSNTEIRVPYMNPKDCSQGFCTKNCPQLCYIVYPPPPIPPPFEFPNEDSSPNFSPLVIAIVGILASAFLLVSYYAVISKYCKNRDLSSSRRRDRALDMILDENVSDPSLHLPWNVSTNGLDEELIKSITMLKFNKEDRVVQETDCSICLSEFHDDESLRLLPKCSHAFHASCIDVWLQSHSNCPLCRANIVFMNYEIIEISPQEQNNVVEGFEANTGITGSGEQENVGQTNPPWTDIRSEVDVQDSETTVLVQTQKVRRSVSMDNVFHGRLSIADILRTSGDDIEDYHIRELPKLFQVEVGTSRHSRVVVEDVGSSSNMNKALHHGMSPVRMKRSFSSGRFIFPKCGRGRNTIIPL